MEFWQKMEKDNDRRARRACYVIDVSCFSGSEFPKILQLSLWYSISRHIAMASSETVTKRLHIAGLTPNITPAHLKDRFGSFGTVSEVEDMALDPLGMPPGL